MSSNNHIPIPGHLTILQPQNPNPKPICLPIEIVLVRKMCFDTYEREFGDGFYPQLTPMVNSYGNNNTGYDSIDIKFRWSEIYPCVWTQIDNSVIYGFDGKYGAELLHSLNEEADKSATQISNAGGRIIHPKTTINSTYRLIDARY
jgi:hypothetical protein